jgi:uncharacterized protein (TIGR00725 family)
MRPDRPSADPITSPATGRRTVIAVIGSGDGVEPATLELAEVVGRLVAERGAVLVTGGRGGVMEAASRGAHDAGGLVIGILPGTDPTDANAAVDIALPTGLGFSVRNVITIRAADAVIMIQGEVGTLAEAILAYQHGKPLVAVSSTGGWAERLRMAALDDGRYLDGRQLMEISYAETAVEAVDAAFARIGTVPTPARI